MFLSRMVRNMRIYRKYAISFSTVSFPISSQLVQVLVFVAHNIITMSDKVGWWLLRALRSFTIVDLYLSFEEHTQDTIDAGRRELKRFEEYMQVLASF
jgi:hypothetical protein